MIYSARIYTNTGFNSINVPDSPALLNAMSHVDLPVLDLNQERFLPYVNLKTTWDVIKDADYCKVGDFFYFINNITMTSMDVARVTLTPDFVTSAGGFNALEILGGLTSRVHVVDDTFGLYGEDDPYTAPSYDMDVMIDRSGKFGESGSQTFVETTVDLYDLGNMYVRNKGAKAMTFIDQSNPDEYIVTVPTVKDIPKSTTYKMSGYNNLNWGNSKVLKKIDGQGVYQMTTYVGKGIAMARCLGIEQAISGQYTIPKELVKVDLNGATATDPVPNLIGKNGSKTVNAIPFVYGASVKNSRVYYGNYTKYTLTSCAGNSVSVNAEEIYDGTPYPKVHIFVDPRRLGKPYFRFEPMNGISSTDDADMFRNCVAGCQWLSDPMVLTEKSGSAIDMMNFQSSQMMRQQGIDQAAQNLALGKMGNMANTVMNGFDFSMNPDGGSTFGMNFGAYGRGAMAEFTMEHLYDQFMERQALQKANEVMQFKVAQNVKAPTVNFGGNPDLMNELTGNGYVVYRTVYKSQDIARVDKILTAFGYKYTKILENSDFFNRRYFNYVEGSITVGNLPKWWADGVSAQIAGGVRVWHVKPNHTYYSNNPV